MSYYSDSALKDLGLKHLGKNVKISDQARIYNLEEMEIGDNSRIDDFCVISGRVKIGSYCHITPMCLIAGGLPGVVLSDFCTLAYGVKIFAQSDDYSGETMVNSTIPREFKKEKFEPVLLKRRVVVGAGSIVMPGVEIAEGCAIGAMTLVQKSTQPWGIYVGSPARRIKERSMALIRLEEQFLKERHDPI